LRSTELHTSVGLIVKQKDVQSFLLILVLLTDQGQNQYLREASAVRQKQSSKIRMPLNNKCAKYLEQTLL